MFKLEKLFKKSESNSDEETLILAEALYAIGYIKNKIEKQFNNEEQFKQVVYLIKEIKDGSDIDLLYLKSLYELSVVLYKNNRLTEALKNTEEISKSIKEEKSYEELKILNRVLKGNILLKKDNKSEMILVNEKIFKEENKTIKERINTCICRGV